MVFTSHTCLVAHVVIPFHRLQTKIPSQKGRDRSARVPAVPPLFPEAAPMAVGALGPGSLQTPRPAKRWANSAKPTGRAWQPFGPRLGRIFAGALRVCSHRSVRHRRTGPDSLSDRCPLLVSVAAFARKD